MRDLIISTPDPEVIGKVSVAGLQTILHTWVMLRSLLILFMLTGCTRVEAYDHPNHRWSINLAEPSSYANSVPWRDVWRQRDRGETTRDGQWSTHHEGTFPTDAQGYPLAAPFNGEAFRYTAFTPKYSGRYTVTWKGTGSISFPVLNSALVQLGDHTATLDLMAGNDPVFVQIDQSLASNPIKDIHILLPSGVKVSGEYTQDFLQQLTGAQQIRCMDWLRTNNSTVKNPQDLTVEGGVGVTFAECIKLANQLGAQAWINIPHQASDDTIRAIAQQVKAASPVRAPIVEYSNEAWNGIFTQHGYVKEQGMKAGLQKTGDYQGSDFWAGMKWFARRTTQVHQVFAQQGVKIVRVIGGWSANQDVNQHLLQFTSRKIDALAIAPYFGHALGEDSFRGRTERQVLDGLRETIPTAVQEVKDARSAAAKFQVKLYSYEAGPHLLANNDAAKAKLFERASRDPGMEAVLAQYLQEVGNALGDQPVTLFNNVGAYSQWGSWGLAEQQTQLDTPKMRGLRRYSAR